MFNGELPRDVDLAMTGFEEHSDWIIFKTEYTKKGTFHFVSISTTECCLSGMEKKKELTYH